MSKRKIIVNIVTPCLLACIAIGAFVMARVARDRAAALAEESIIQPAEESEMIAPGVEKKTHKGDDYYLFRVKYDGEYDLQCRTTSDGSLSDIDICSQMDYVQYQDLCKRYRLDQKYTDERMLYLVRCFSVNSSVDVDAELATVEYCEDAVDLYIYSRFYGVTGDDSAYFCIVPTAQAVKHIQIIPLYTDEEYQNLIQYGQINEPEEFPEPMKPIIYLYPEKETDVTVALGHPECVTHSYPKYDGPWRVTAQPDGTLTDLNTGRELYSLYYENVSPIPLLQTDEGFVVRGEGTAAFLEEKLAVLGLNDREAEEFIIYWLPRLEENEWNYIRFASREEIDAEMPLEIAPQPDSVIRVLMLYKSLDAPIEVREQNLTTPARTGFTAVEWGGAELS